MTSPAPIAQELRKLAERLIDEDLQQSARFDRLNESQIERDVTKDPSVASSISKDFDVRFSSSPEQWVRNLTRVVEREETKPQISFSDIALDRGGTAKEWASGLVDDLASMTFNEKGERERQSDVRREGNRASDEPHIDREVAPFSRQEVSQNSVHPQRQASANSGGFARLVRAMVDAVKKLFKPVLDLITKDDIDRSGRLQSSEPTQSRDTTAVRTSQSRTAANEVQSLAPAAKQAVGQALRQIIGNSPELQDAFRDGRLPTVAYLATERITTEVNNAWPITVEEQSSKRWNQSDVNKNSPLDNIEKLNDRRYGSSSTTPTAVYAVDESARANAASLRAKGFDRDSVTVNPTLLETKSVPVNPSVNNITSGPSR